MKYDTLILGGGPAGYSAAIYAARYNMKCAVIAREPGGVMNEAYKVENYPGFKSIVGIELMDKIRDHLGVDVKEEEIIKVIKDKGIFKVKTNKSEYESRTIIIVLGAEHRKLNVPGEKELEKRGISYCYTCDGAFYKNKKVIVVGGGDAASQAVLLLASYNNEVNLLYRSVIRAEPYYQEQFKKLKNVKLVKGEIARINGKNKVESIVLKDGKEIKIDGVFVEIGYSPATYFLNGLVDLNEKKEIIFDTATLATKTPGLFSAGDCNVSKYKQIVMASGEGAKAALSAYEYIKRTKN